MKERVDRLFCFLIVKVVVLVQGRFFHQVGNDRFSSDDPDKDISIINDGHIVLFERLLEQLVHRYA